MPLPSNFNEWEHLQNQVMREHNKMVKAWFKNQNDNDISTPKASLKHACIMKDEDTVSMMIERQWLFEVVVGHTQSIQAPIYGIPVIEKQSQVKFKPQVHLHFRERFPYINERIRPMTGEISFRIMNESGETWNRSKSEALATKIKNKFTNPIFEWKKGKYYYYYRDIGNGIDLRILCTSEPEGRRVADAVVDVAGHTFNADYEQFMEHNRSYPNTQPNITIYGRSQPKPIERPTVDVRFRYAQLLLHGQRAAVNLVATTEVGWANDLEV